MFIFMYEKKTVKEWSNSKDNEIAYDQRITVVLVQLELILPPSDVEQVHFGEAAAFLSELLEVLYQERFS